MTDLQILITRVAILRLDITKWQHHLKQSRRLFYKYDAASCQSMVNFLMDELDRAQTELVQFEAKVV